MDNSGDVNIKATDKSSSIECANKSILYKKYNLHGIHNEKIPGSTKRHWNSKRRIQQSLKKHPRNEADCEENSIRYPIDDTKTDQPFHAESIASTSFAACGKSTGMRGILPIKGESSDSESDFFDCQMDPSFDTLDENSMSCQENQSQFYNDKVLVPTLLFMAMKLCHNLTYKAIEDIVELHGVLSNSTIPLGTKYHWKKMIDEYFSESNIHHFCPACESYIGEATSRSIHCDQCNRDIDVKTNIKSHNIFIYISLARQLKEVFETTDAHENIYLKNIKKSRDYAIEEIFDGKMYKKIMNDGMISINFGIDGVPVFDSSNCAIWPILCIINELEPTRRRQNLLLCGLWFGQRKPRMSEYLKPFIAESKILDAEGFNYEFKGIRYNKRCRVLVCVSDSVARPLLRNSTQFNGEYGCGLCLHPGQTVAKGKGFTRVYPLAEDNTPFGEGLRTNETTMHHSRCREKGMKGPPILTEIPGFDIVQSLPADWMHAVALGVCRQFAKLWLDSANHDEDFYFGHLSNQIDSLLESFRPDSKISRTPRKISDRTNWKAHEWTIFLLFYSLPILRALFPYKYVDHWALLVDGISILLHESIMPSEIEYSRQCLIKFIKGVEQLYGQKHVSFNVHLLAHLPECVTNWGPLWTHSMFPYENANQELLKMVKSSTGVALQICNTFRLKCMVDRLYIRCSESLTDAQATFLNTLLKREKKILPSLILNNTHFLGSPIHLETLSRDQFLALQRLNINIDPQTTIQCYKRVVVGKENFHSEMYCRDEKRANRYALLNTQEIFEIESFLVVKVNDTDVPFAIGRYFDRTNDSFIRYKKLNHLIVLRKRQENLAAVETSLLKEKVTLIEMNDHGILIACVHPNRYELLT